MIGLLRRINDYNEKEADFDAPGVTISFINISENLIKNCLAFATQQNTFNLLQGLNKVTGPGVYEHDEEIAAYFAKTSSKGAYKHEKKFQNYY